MPPAQRLHLTPRLDDGAPTASYLLPGSAVPAGDEDEDGPTHSGAGRIMPIRMRSLSIAERNLGPSSVRLADLLSGAQGKIAGTPRR
ncbi:MAG: hypothetical protein ABJA80_14850 [bacterium]